MYEEFRVANEETGDFEPYLVDGRDAGELALLRKRGHDGRPLIVGYYRCPHEFSGTEEYQWDEAMYILQGSCTVDFADSSTTVLKPGDMVTFKVGTRVSFTQSPDFKKFFIRTR